MYGSLAKPSFESGYWRASSPVRFGHIAVCQQGMARMRWYMLNMVATHETIILVRYL